VYRTDDGKSDPLSAHIRASDGLCSTEAWRFDERGTLLIYRHLAMTRGAL
jgi:hypothetical protein